MDAKARVPLTPEAIREAKSLIEEEKNSPTIDKMEQAQLALAAEKAAHAVMIKKAKKQAEEEQIKIQRIVDAKLKNLAIEQHESIKRAADAEAEKRASEHDFKVQQGIDAELEKRAMANDTQTLEQTTQIESSWKVNDTKVKNAFAEHAHAATIYIKKDLEDCLHDLRVIDPTDVAARVRMDANLKQSFLEIGLKLQLDFQKTLNAFYPNAEAVKVSKTSEQLENTDKAPLKEETKANQSAVQKTPALTTVVEEAEPEEALTQAPKPNATPGPKSIFGPEWSFDAIQSTDSKPATPAEEEVDEKLVRGSAPVTVAKEEDTSLQPTSGDRPVRKRPLSLLRDLPWDIMLSVLTHATVDDLPIVVDPFFWSTEPEDRAAAADVYRQNNSAGPRPRPGEQSVGSIIFAHPNLFATARRNYWELNWFRISIATFQLHAKTMEKWPFTQYKLREHQVERYELGYFLQHIRYLIVTNDGGAGTVDWGHVFRFLQAFGNLNTVVIDLRAGMWFERNIDFPTVRAAPEIEQALREVMNIKVKEVYLASGNIETMDHIFFPEDSEDSEDDEDSVA